MVSASTGGAVTPARSSIPVTSLSTASSNSSCEKSIADGTRCGCVGVLSPGGSASTPAKAGTPADTYSSTRLWMSVNIREEYQTRLEAEWQGLLCAPRLASKCRITDESITVLRAYPVNLVARYVISARAKCKVAR